MKKLYFCSIDGNQRKVFKSEDLAKHWEEQGELYFSNEVVFDELNNILKIDNQDFLEYVENCSDEQGTEEFDRVKSCFEKEFAFKDVTDD